MNKDIEKLKEMLKEISKEKQTDSENEGVLIHGDSNHIQIKGVLPEVMAMLTRIIKAIHNETGAKKYLFEKAISLAFMDDDEVHNELKKELNEFMDNLRGLLDE